MINPSVLEQLPDAARAKSEEELDARITQALGEDARSLDVSLLLQEVEVATEAADATAGEARALALNPLVVDVIVARRAMDDAAFKRDRLIEAAKRLGKRVDELKALEADSRMWAEHERVLIERDRLAEEMEGMADPIAQIAHLVRQIDACDRVIRRLNNATPTAKFGHIPFVLSGATPAVAAVFQDVIVRDVFTQVAGLQSPPAPVVRGHQTANATDARQRPS